MKEKNNMEPIYTITGTVVHGRGIGKHVGTPTANIEVDEHATLPETGVYVAKILLDNLICAVVSEMAEILLVSLCIGFLLIEVFSRMTEGIISIHITPFFLCGTLLLLLFTLVISVIIPVIRILKIHPAEVIS